jgi:hypothetical protein
MFFVEHYKFYSFKFIFSNWRGGFWKGIKTRRLKQTLCHLCASKAENEELEGREHRTQEGRFEWTRSSLMDCPFSTISEYHREK